MNWRSENWDKRAWDFTKGAPEPRGYFEAGADGMLEALYQESQKSGSGWLRFDKADDGHILIYCAQKI